MSQKIEISCGEGRNAYQVILIGKTFVFSEEMDKHPDVIDKEGEARVAAILAAGGVLNVARRRKGKRTDGEKGEPALLTFDSNGNLICVEHHADGKPVSAERYKDGKKVAAPDDGLMDRFKKSLHSVKSRKEQIVKAVKASFIMD
ncbi:MAG: hypothetical protein V1721_04595 [Pseudomonadota bacterium]